MKTSTNTYPQIQTMRFAFQEYCKLYLQLQINTTKTERGVKYKVVSIRQTQVVRTEEPV